MTTQTLENDANEWERWLSVCRPGCIWSTSTDTHWPLPHEGLDWRHTQLFIVVFETGSLKGPQTPDPLVPISWGLRLQVYATCTADLRGVAQCIYLVCECEPMEIRGQFSFPPYGFWVARLGSKCFSLLSHPANPDLRFWRGDVVTVSWSLFWSPHLFQLPFKTSLGTSA